jgi:sorting nexin-9/18/33
LARISSSFNQLSEAFAISNTRLAGDEPLKEALKHTGATYEAIGRLYDEQPRHDLEPLSDALYEYKGILSAWPEILQVHKGALNRKKEYLKLKEEGRSDSASSVSRRADVVSYATLAEVNHFHEERVTDFNRIMHSFLSSQIEFYQQIVEQLQGTLQRYQNA